MVWKIRSKFTQGLLIFHCHKSGHTIWSRETEIGEVFDFVNTAKSFTATDFSTEKNPLNIVSRHLDLTMFIATMHPFHYNILSQYYCYTNEK